MGSSALACGGCTLTYKTFRSGMTFTDVARELRYSCDRDGNERRFVSVSTVLGRWWQNKQRLWAEHLRTCGFGVVDASDHQWRTTRGRWYLELDSDTRYHLDAQAGASLDVELDGDVYQGVLDDEGRLVVQANWRDLVLPCSWVRVRNANAIAIAEHARDQLEAAPF